MRSEIKRLIADYSLCDSEDELNALTDIIVDQLDNMKAPSPVKIKRIIEKEIQLWIANKEIGE